MSLLLDALKKAAEQKAAKSRQEDESEASSSDETIYYGFHDGQRWWLRHGISVFSANWAVD